MDERLERLSATAGNLAHLVAEATDDDLDAAPPGGRTIRQLLALLRERESAQWRATLEALRAGTAPVPFDPDGWLDAADLRDVTKRRLLGDIALQRQASINRLEQLDPAAWRDVAAEVDGVRTTIADVVDQWIEADAATIRDIEAALGRTLTEILEHRFASRG